MGGFLEVRSMHEEAERERKRENLDFAAPPAASAWGCRAIFRPRWLDAAVVVFG